MDALRYTLVADGSSDRALLPILTWLLRLHGVQRVEPEWAEFRYLPQPPRTLAEKISRGLALFPCDLFFVHRDAEGQPPDARHAEIQAAVATVQQDGSVPPTVSVVPVRMQEAWLLGNAQAIRQAAGNPHGRMPLELPSLAALEVLPDAKKVLYDLLRQASGLQGRRYKHFAVRERALRVAEVTDDFTPLRALSAFRRLEDEVQAVLVRFPEWTR